MSDQELALVTMYDQFEREAKSVVPLDSMMVFSREYLGMLFGPYVLRTDNKKPALDRAGPRNRDMFQTKVIVIDIDSQEYSKDIRGFRKIIDASKSMKTSPPTYMHTTKSNNTRLIYELSRYVTLQYANDVREDVQNLLRGANIQGIDSCTNAMTLWQPLGEDAKFICTGSVVEV